ncbi:MAG: hypothetical protein SGPRY_012432, partial [Prymnesium sp.]
AAPRRHNRSSRNIFGKNSKTSPDLTLHECDGLEEPSELALRASKSGGSSLAEASESRRLRKKPPPPFRSAQSSAVLPETIAEASDSFYHSTSRPVGSTAAAPSPAKRVQSARRVEDIAAQQEEGVPLRVGIHSRGGEVVNPKGKEAASCVDEEAADVYAKAEEVTSNRDELTSHGKEMTSQGGKELSRSMKLRVETTFTSLLKDMRSRGSQGSLPAHGQGSRRQSKNAGSMYVASPTEGGGGGWENKGSVRRWKAATHSVHEMQSANQLLSTKESLSSPNAHTRHLSTSDHHWYTKFAHSVNKAFSEPTRGFGPETLNLQADASVLQRLNEVSVPSPAFAVAIPSHLPP